MWCQIILPRPTVAALRTAAVLLSSLRSSSPATLAGRLVAFAPGEAMLRPTG